MLDYINCHQMLESRYSPDAYCLRTVSSLNVALSSAEFYVSIDIEADGPVPGLHSMLSLGAAAFSSDGGLKVTFSVNLEALPEAHEDARTMRWWASQPAAWEACRAQTQESEQAMRSFHV